MNAFPSRPHVDLPDPAAPLVARVNELTARVAELERLLAAREGPQDIPRAL